MSRGGQFDTSVTRL
nr:unnamed protein product [Callosobruchus chinensis]